MIDRYTIKFAPALSQKELEKVLHENIDPATVPEIHKMRARIEIVADFEENKNIATFLKKAATD